MKINFVQNLAPQHGPISRGFPGGCTEKKVGESWGFPKGVLEAVAKREIICQLPFEDRSRSARREEPESGEFLAHPPLLLVLQRSIFFVFYFFIELKNRFD